MKKSILILISLVILSCNSKPTEIRYYPTDELKSDESTVLINLDTTELNFKEITNLIRLRQSEYKKLIIEINDNGIIKNITPNVYNGGLIRERNVLSIKSDSILIDNGHPMSELKSILKRHYTNNDEHHFYPVSYKKAIIEVTIDTNSNGVKKNSLKSNKNI